MRDLVGKVINKIEMSDDTTVMVFTTDSGEKIAYLTEGDCCSYSWFSHITNLDTLLGQKVNEVVEREEFSKEEYEKAEKEGDYESLALYGYMLKTNKGTCDIEFRNDSNGYYGGWCERYHSLPDDLHEVKEDI